MVTYYQLACGPSSYPLNFRPVAFSLMASFMSAVTLIGVSNENYQFGTQFVAINVSYGLATPIAAYLFLPVFYNMRVTSAYEVSQLLKCSS